MQNEPEEEKQHDMLEELHNLFMQIQNHKKDRGAFNHKKFIKALKKTNALFDNDDHHDSHEFINWLLDKLHESAVRSLRPDLSAEQLMFGQAETMNSFMSDLFRGELENKVTCITCETITKRKEAYMNLSLDVEKNTSLSYCIQRFAFKELLNQDNKLMCDTCLSRQVATKEITISKFPKLLLCHMKRFRINTETFTQEKLNYRIPFSEEMRLEANGKQTVYHLKGVVIHEGQGL